MRTTFTLFLFSIISTVGNSQQWTLSLFGGQRLNSSVYTDVGIVGSTSDLRHFTFHSPNWTAGARATFKPKKLPIIFRVELIRGTFTNVLSFKKFTTINYGIPGFDKINIPYQSWEGRLGLSYHLLDIKKKGQLGLIAGFSGFHAYDLRQYDLYEGKQEVRSETNELITMTYAAQHDKLETHGLTFNTGLYYSHFCSERLQLFFDIQYSAGLKTGQSFWFLYETNNEQDWHFLGDGISYMNWDNINISLGGSYAF